jgi:hypothetical protein
MTRSEPQTGRSLRPLAGAIWLVSVGLAAVSWLVILITFDRPVPDQFGLRGMNGLVGVTFATVGFAVLRQRPDHGIGWILTVTGLLAATNGVLSEWGSLSALPGATPQIPTLLAWLVGWIWVPLLALTMVVIPLLYPTGALPSHRWRPVAALAGAASVVATAGAALMPGPIDNAEMVVNPFGLPIDRATYEQLYVVILLPLAVTVILAVVSLVLRYRTADRETQLQIKWLALASSVSAVAFAFVAVTASGANAGPLVKAAESLLLLSILGIAAAVGLAILRYRLYEIDRIISRSLGWTAVSAISAVVFGAGVVALQQLLAGFTQGQTLAVAMSTLIALALFQPLRLRVQRSVDRRFDRARYDAERTAAAFAGRLRDRLDLVRLEGDVSETVRGAMRPRSFGLWVRGASGNASQETRGT